MQIDLTEREVALIHYGLKRSIDFFVQKASTMPKGSKQYELMRDEVAERQQLLKRLPVMP